MKIPTFFSIPLLLLSLAFTGQVSGHSFSTSFLNIDRDGLLKYQISFHDLVALNDDWIDEGKISKQLLNGKLNKLEQFLNQTVSLNQCHLVLTHNNPWVTVTYAKEQYLVLQAEPDCDQPLTSVTVYNVWTEFPDHRVIVESSLLDTSSNPTVIDIEQRTVIFNFES